MPLAMARAQVGNGFVLQGNLDPIVLASNRSLAVEQTKKILLSMKRSPFIFNLGHGVVPHTPIENVQAVCDTIREFGK
jgi:uroporphyrinogen decarboxylase